MIRIAAASVLVSIVALAAQPASAQCGQASWYALDGRTTANGEVMNSGVMTAAHPSLPFGTKVEVTNMLNGRSTVVRINDRGPFAKSRIIDVTKSVAHKLGFRGRGHAPVKLAWAGGGSVSC